MITNVYIDGFNLYYGLLKGTPFKWLNLERFCDAALPRNTVKKIYFFTAVVEARPNDPNQPIRQIAYLNALKSLPRVEVHYGSFMSSVVSQAVVASDPMTGRWLRHEGEPVLKTTADGQVFKTWVYRTEEKGSDVNLACHLLHDAHRSACECAVVISNDSDLLTPIRMAKINCGLKVGLILPRPKGSLELKALADFRLHPRRHTLSEALFSESVNTPVGKVTKPQSW